MRVRHRTPSIFNISMVDVLCCALGCVILLWLLNLREAKEKSASVGQTSEKLTATLQALDEASSWLLTVARDRDQVAEQAERAAQERDRLQADLGASRSRLDTLEKEIASLKALNTETEDRLAKLTRDRRALEKDKESAARELASLESRLRDKDELARMTARRVDDLAGQVKMADAKSKNLTDDLQTLRSKLAAAEARVQSLEDDARLAKKDLADAKENVLLLQGDKRYLADQVTRAKAAAENRFEGIQLTGRRVLFLVDMSGSMELVDEKTPDPQKWVGVRETVAKIMRSLPDLNQFQVIVFSRETRFLLGNDGRWLDYDPKTSAEQVLKGLAAIAPRGGTNMTDAFDAAFRFRTLGLDTIYVMSDGLPNIGPGLTAEQEQNLSETQRSEILARHIRNLLRKDWNRDQPGRPRVRINTVGFFYESPDVGAFLWALARENDGSFVGMSKP
jgi:hypothetical protein